MADFIVADHGSIFLVTPVTDAAKTWLDEHTETEGWQWMGPALAVEHRYVEALMMGAVDDGLEVNVE
jgi:hypothetical protein